MPDVRPFCAIQFDVGAGPGNGDLSGVISPPYDVLDGRAKARLLERDPRNITAIDLPHVPPKELGPSSAYEAAAKQLAALLKDGTLAQREVPAIYAYRERFEFMGSQYDRCGMACTVGIVPFGPRDGGGILPHEQTFSGPKEDRMALMQATRAQLSPIFGLHADASGSASSIVRAIMDSRAPDATADMGDGVTHELWAVEDREQIGAYRDALAGEDVFIADGHHRYTTALNYLRGLESQGELPEDHPARRCMIVLVSMSDPGLAIGPTHRVLGGMSGYSIDNFMKACEGVLEIKPSEGGPEGIERAIEARSASNPRVNTLGLVDRETGRCFTACPVDPDPLAGEFGSKPEAWRTLDVAIIQHLIVEKICQPKLNAGQPVKWAFPHSISEVMEIFEGAETGAGGGGGFAQLAVIVRPTPLDAVREVSRANELMPQKSTFFYPKLATGLFMHRVE